MLPALHFPRLHAYYQYCLLVRVCVYRAPPELRLGPLLRVDQDSVALLPPDKAPATTTVLSLELGISDNEEHPVMAMDQETAYTVQPSGRFIQRRLGLSPTSRPRRITNTPMGSSLGTEYAIPSSRLLTSFPFYRLS